MDKYSFLRGMVEGAKRTGKNVNFKDVSTALNQNGFKTNRGTPYNPEGGRGIAKLISSLFGRTKKSGNSNAASDVAHKVVGKNGKQSWL